MSIKNEALKSVANIKEGAQAFLLISISPEGKCDIQGSGLVTQMTFMNKSLDLFIHKLINGELDHSGPELKVVK